MKNSVVSESSYGKKFVKRALTSVLPGVIGVQYYRSVVNAERKAELEYESNKGKSYPFKILEGIRRGKAFIGGVFLDTSTALGITYVLGNYLIGSNESFDFDLTSKLVLPFFGIRAVINTSFGAVNDLLHRDINRLELTIESEKGLDIERDIVIHMRPKESREVLVKKIQISNQLKPSITEEDCEKDI
jgi:hypothetical protein